MPLPGFSFVIIYNIILLLLCNFELMICLYIFQDVEQRYLRGKVSLNEATQTMDTNPIKTAITVCSELIRKQVIGTVTQGYK